LSLTTSASATSPLWWTNGAEGICAACATMCIYTRCGPGWWEPSSRCRLTGGAVARSTWRWLAAAGWTEGDLAKRPKAAPGEIKLARELRRQTPMTRQWIAQRLHMGSASYVDCEE